MTDPIRASQIKKSAAEPRLGARALAGVAGIVGGLIHLLGPLAYPHMGEVARQSIWIMIDLLLLLAMLGLQATAGRALGRLGLSGFVLALAAVLLVRSAATNVLGPNTYEIAASLWSIGMAVVASALLRERLPYRAPAMLWIAALAIGGVGLALNGAPAAHQVAGACFGLAFISLGVQLFRSHGHAAIPGA